MATTFKALSARRVEARSRAKTLRVRVEMVIRGKHYLARSQSGNGTYQIDRTAAGWTCTCDGYRWTGCCKHIAGVERRSEREGWKFGTVARIA